MKRLPNIEKIKKLPRDLKNGFGLFFKDDFFHSKIVLWLSILSLVANLANWIALLIFIKPVDLTIILHYNVYFGVDSIGNYRKAYLSPIIGLFILGVNFLLAKYFYAQKERIAAYLILLAALMAGLSLLIASAGVIIINY